MFLFFSSLFFVFGLTSGTLVLGSHFLSFWEGILLSVSIFLCTIFTYFVIGACLYGYCYYDFCVILMLDYCNIYLSFSCTGFYLFILLLINLVFCFILFYAFYYMYFDLFLSRFLNIFWLFVVCMNFFILSHDLLTAYCGWELLGLFSFFLISYFWYRFFSINFGFNAFFVSNIGDILLITAFSLLFSMNGFCLATFYYINFLCIDYYCMCFIITLLLCCAFTKSTQFGLHIWLPDAMEGPIPVSALIHAATLVVCGIILLSFIFWCFDFWFSYFYNLIIWATLIIVVMSICVFYNFDAKRYIAFSTICQISFSMFCCICLDLYVGCLFFCYHMLYNASLFIIIGVWIHIFFGLQDLSCYFFLYFCGCILASLLLIFAILNSCSIWFLCGFYCNDLLLCILMLLSFYNIIEFIFICVMFIFFTIVYNYFMLFFLFFTFNCFCLVDCVFLIFDFECCLIYCTLCVYMCFISLFFVLDILYTFVFSSYCIFWAFYLYYYNFFDIVIFVLFLIVSIAFLYYGSIFFYFFNVDCIMLFWRIFLSMIIVFVFAFFCCWYFICFSIYVLVFTWNFVIFFSYNLNYCLFFCILWVFYI